MPLIILSGFPTSGKSTRAQQLFDYLQERVAADGANDSEVQQFRLHLISDDSLSISRAVYDLSTVPSHVRSANASEKDARAALYGAVKRVLSARDIVVLDGLNYIKGWRYQLAMEAKNARTASAVLQIGCSVEQAKAQNEQRIAENHPQMYSQANWDNLVFRYEEPNPMARWDSPLFALTWDDDAATTRAVFDRLWDAVIAPARQKAVRPNLVAVQRGGGGRNRDAPGDFLYLLDRETQDMVKRLLDAQQHGQAEGGSVTIPIGDGHEDLVVELPSNRVGLPQLQRLRRAFVGLKRGGIGLDDSAGQLTAPRIRESFVGYLNDAFEKDI